MTQHQMWLVDEVDTMPLCSVWSYAKREASRSKVNNSGMFVKDTPMLKTIKRIEVQVEEQNFDK